MKLATSIAAVVFLIAYGSKTLINEEDGTISLMPLGKDIPTKLMFTIIVILILAFMKRPMETEKDQQVRIEQVYKMDNEGYYLDKDNNRITIPKQLINGKCVCNKPTKKLSEINQYVSSSNKLVLVNKVIKNKILSVNAIKERGIYGIGFFIILTIIGIFIPFKSATDSTLSKSLIKTLIIVSLVITLLFTSIGISQSKHY